MPNNIVKSIADKTGKSVDDVEKLWNKAKTIAKDNGKSEDDDDFYPYVTGILKKMAKVNEKKTFHQFMEEIDKFKRKPKIVSAFQWKGNADEIPDEIKSHKMFSMKSNTITIKTLEGDMHVSLNDWIVIGVKNELFPVKPDVFKLNYEKGGS